MKRFDLPGNQSSVKQEMLAGTVAFVTVIYIVVVNGAIMADAGIPLEFGIVASILSAAAGCLLMGLWSNTPVILVPGMGINALFSYTMVHTLGLSWQEALAAVFVSGLLFMLIAFSRLSTLMATAIPSSLKDAISVGLGLFLAFIGLQKGSLIVTSERTFVALGNLASSEALVTLITLVFALVLFSRNVPGSLLISIFAGTLLAIPFGLMDGKDFVWNGFSLLPEGYSQVFAALSFEKLATFSFWAATFSMTMVIVFDSMGLIHGMVRMLGRPDLYEKTFQGGAMSATLTAFFGSSPTVVAVETAAGITAGGRTGLTSITTGVLFLCTLAFLPFISLIPDSAIAPVLILIGGLMMQNVQSISFTDFSEGFPAFLIIAMIPLTFSIIDGIAFGFIAYLLIKLALGRGREVPPALYVITLLFLLHFWLYTIGT